MSGRKLVANIVGVVLLLIVGFRMLPDFGGSILPIPPAAQPGSWVVVLEESTDRTAEVAKLVADAEWQKAIVDRGAKFRLMDDDEAGAASYLPIAGETRPVVLIVSPAGKLLGTSTAVDRESIADFLRAKAGI